MGKKHPLRTWGSERGVILPLMAFVALGVIVAYVVLGIDSLIVKYSSVTLRAEANQICSALSTGPISSTRALVSAFATEVDDFSKRLNSTIRITSANLIIPLATASTAIQPFPDSFDLAGQNGVTSNPWDPVSPHPGPPPPPPSLRICGSGILPDLGIECSNTFCGQNQGKCIFQNSVNHSVRDVEGFTMSDKYPNSLFSNLLDTGSVVGCEINAEVDTFFSQEKKVVARAFFWRPARGTSSFAPGNSVVFDRTTTPVVLPVPGLSIAVATQLQTDISQKRFNLNDPLWAPFNSATYNPHAASASLLGQVSFAHDATNAGSNSPGAIPSISNPTNVYRAQMLAACINGATLVRNAYLTTIVELASRHGHFRNATEIIHVNPQSRALGLGGASGTPEEIMFPALMVPFGADLASAGFTIPFVNFYGGMIEEYDPGAPIPNGIEVQVPPEFGLPIGEGNRYVDGFLIPFSAATTQSAPPSPDWQLGWGSGGAGSATVSMHAVLASQLRHCYHLYSPTGGVKRFEDLGLIDLYDQTFEPPSYDTFDVTSGISTGFLRPLPYPQGIDSWDQRCPWKAPLVPGTTPDPPYFPWLPENGELISPCSGNAASTLISASELVGSLGTTQICPYPLLNGLTQLPPTDDRCIKPQNTWSGLPANPLVPTYDLRPDLVATLSYMGKAQASPLPAMSSITIPAINPPGLWSPLLQENNPSFDWLGLEDGRYPFGAPTGPLATRKYSEAYLTTSNVLLVTHQRIHSSQQSPPPPNCRSCSCSGPANDEYCKIQCLVRSNAFKAPNPLDPTSLIPRQILIAYFPTTSLDASPQAISNLMCAFEATEDRRDTSKNLFEVFSPTTDIDFQTLLPSCASPSSESAWDDCFVEYWKYLLTDRTTDDKNIVDLARRDFLERLTTQSVKF